LPIFRGEMSTDERKEVGLCCKENPHNASRYEEHRLLVQKLNEYQRRIDFRTKLEAVSANVDSANLQDKRETSKIIALWKNYGLTTLIAASVALMIVFSTLWMSGFYSN